MIIKKNVIFKDINLKLNSQSILIVNGKNGSGKTSFLKLIAGFIKPTAGNITCVDHNIKDYLEDYIHDFSYLATDDIFNYEFLTKYYLNLWAQIYEAKESLESVIHYFNLKNILNLQIKQISSGWKKRLLLAKIMLENKMILLLDEPFNFLDQMGSDLLINMINSKLLSGGIVILTSNQKIDQFKTAQHINIDMYK